jgi:hypothetical protein
LIVIISAVLAKLAFPKEDDLRKKKPKESLEAVIKLARKVANREAKPAYVQFIDQDIFIYIETKSNGSCFFDSNESNPDRRDSIMKFLETTTGSKPAAWPSSGSYKTTTPLFLVTDVDKKAIFDENKVCYAIIQNPNQNLTNKQITGGDHKAFEEGSIDNSRKWQQKGGTTCREYFIVYPSGLCDSVSFKAEKCPEYNHNYAVNPISGTVEELP